jgi:phosphoribosyl 1,2-cyclic phosphodiesterase
VDAGTGFHALGNRLLREKNRRFHLIMTHAHWDHIIGFPFFQPLCRLGNRLDVYGPKLNGQFFQTVIKDLVKPPYFPIPLDDMMAVIRFHDLDETSFRIGTLRIDPVALNHPNGGLGYRFSERDRTFVFLTDNELGVSYAQGHSFEEFRNFSDGTDLLIHDAMYTPKEYSRRKGWGHSHYRDALRLAMQSDAKRLGLFHHHPDRTDDELKRILASCRRTIRNAGSSLDCFIASRRMEIRL